MNGTAFGPDLSLTPSQEGLLRTALTSNSSNSNIPKASVGARDHGSSSSGEEQYPNGALPMSANMYTSPIQNAPGSGTLDGFDESPFLDYENLDDGNFDWDTTGDQLFGDLPGTEFNDDAEHHDKRKASNDEDAEGEASSKRREADDKSGKKSAQKPGRKPLTAEPTTVRSTYPGICHSMANVIYRSARRRTELPKGRFANAKNVT